VGFYRPAVQFDQTAHQCEADPYTASRTVVLALGLHKEVEDAGQHVWRNANPIILHPQHDLMAFLPSG
jgi:hypothetical protein